MPTTKSFVAQLKYILVRNIKPILKAQTQSYFYIYIYIYIQTQSYLIKRKLNLCNNKKVNHSLAVKICSHGIGHYFELCNSLVFFI